MRQRRLDPGDVIDRARRAPGGEADAAGQVVFVAVGMGRDLEAHQRHPDEIGDLLRLDQSHRFFGVPLGHQHQFAPQRKALEEQRHFAGDMEQRDIDQRAGLGRGGFALAGHVGQHHHRLRGIAHHPLDHRAMIRPCALRLPGRARGVQDRRKVVAGQRRQRSSRRPRPWQSARPGPARARSHARTARSSRDGTCLPTGRRAAHRRAAGCIPPAQSRRPVPRRSTSR